MCLFHHKLGFLLLANAFLLWLPEWARHSRRLRLPWTQLTGTSVSFCVCCYLTLFTSSMICRAFSWTPKEAATTPPLWKHGPLGRAQSSRVCEACQSGKADDLPEELEQLLKCLLIWWVLSLVCLETLRPQRALTAGLSAVLTFAKQKPLYTGRT